MRHTLCFIVFDIVLVFVVGFDGSVANACMLYYTIELPSIFLRIPIFLGQDEFRSQRCNIAIEECAHINCWK